MSRRADGRGYFGIGIFHSKYEVNVGTLWRSALVLGSSYVFTIGRRYRRQASDTPNTMQQIPCYHYDDFDHFYDGMPKGSVLVGVEMEANAHCVKRFIHPTVACYLLGAEDHGLPPTVMDRCHALVRLPGDRSLNVAAAGSIVMFDRWGKSPKEVQ